MGAWMLDDEPGCGEGIVWRVRSADMNYNTETRSLSLEHIINTLQDDIIFDEVTWEDIAPGSSECSAKSAAQFILAQQSLWRLGDFEFNDIAWPYQFNGDSLYSALQTVANSCPDCCWEYDLSRIPFRLHFRKIPEDATCEMRAGRNIKTLKRVIDRSGMYTRFYPIGKDDLHISGDYISKNESTYGMVAKVETFSGAETESALRSWAWERLKRHCQPKVTVTIGGLELSESTGEPLDKLTMNRKCRVPLPEFSTTITERIIRIRVTDKIRKPEEVTVTLGNELPDLASIVGEVEKEQASGSGGGGRGGMKKAGEDHAWFVDTDTHVGMVAEAIIGHGPDGVDWSRVAEVIVDGDGIHNRVTRAEGYLVTMEAKIDLTEEKLRAEFNNIADSLRSELEMSAESLRVEFENLNNSTRSELQITSESLRAEFENLNNSTRSELQITSESLKAEFTNEINSTRNELLITSESLRSTITDTASGLQTQIDQNKESINLRVSKGDVGTQLAVELGNVSISGGNLVVDGYVTSAGLDAAIGQIHDTYSQNVSTNTFACVTGSARDFTVYGTFKYKSSEEADPVSVLSAICGIGTAQESGGQFSIPTTTVGGSAGPSINFNIAASQTYIDGVAAARRNGRADMGLEADSENGVVKVVQGSTKSLTITATEPEFTYNSSGHYYRATASAKAGDTVMHTVTSLTHSGTQAYTDGRTVGHGEMGVTADTETGKVKAAQSSTKELAITATAPTFSYSATTHKYTATAKAKAGSTEMHTATAVSGTEAYLAGWNAACDAISRSGNSIIGPKKDALGETETKYTAKYTASTYTKSSYTPETYEYLPSSYTASSYTKETHSYTASSYTASTYSASKYTAETHSYKASSHSHTNPSYKLNSGSSITISSSTTLNLSGDNTVQISAGSDSYTASKHSYKASSYTASSYTAGTYTASKHSYKASSYTASKYTAEYMSYVKSSYTASSYTASSFTWE